MSPDLKIATAYVTVLGQDETDPFVKALNQNSRFIRGRLTPALRQMKYMPEVRFRTDTSFDNFARIDALLKSPEVQRDLDGEDGDEDAGSTRSPNETETKTDGAARQEAEGAADQRLDHPGQAERHGLDRCGGPAEMALLRAEGRPCRHARSARLRHAADRAGRCHEDRSLRHGRPQGLSLRRALGRRDDDRRSGRAGGRSSDVRPSEAEIGRSCRTIIGEISQVPPSFSAIKIAGERAYDLAREGETVEIAARDGHRPPAGDHRHAGRRDDGLRGRMRQGHLCPRVRPRHGARARLLRPCRGAAPHRRRRLRRGRPGAARRAGSRRARGAGRA